MKISTNKELGKALKNKEESILIEGDLANKVIRIKATGKLAWGISLAAISTAVAAIFLKGSTAGLTAPITSAAILSSASTAIAVLGPPAAKSAIVIAVAGGGVGVLHTLRKYEIIEQGAKLLKLKKR